jgi:hypothetical protein
LKIENFIELINEAINSTSKNMHKENLRWLKSEFIYTLLLDEVSAKMEEPYNLKQAILMGDKKTDGLKNEIKNALSLLEKAPIQQLFDVYTQKVRSKGEQGVLSALNQKLWTQYVELKNYFSNKT